MTAAAETPRKQTHGGSIVAMPSQSRIGWAQAALLFAVCGIASSQMTYLDNWGDYLLPVPFGILAAWLCVGRAVSGFCLVILDAAVWRLALRVAVELGAEGPTGRKLFAMCLAGLIGGLGVTVSTALAKWQRPTVSSLAAGAAIGAICGLPFAWWLVAGNQAPLPEWAMLLVSFAIWQGAVGLNLWWNFGLGKRPFDPSGRPFPGAETAARQ